MSKPLSKKGVERRKRPRSKGKAKAKPSKAKTTELCPHCNRNIKGSERALFVEEEVGRVFCSEECIAAYFAPEVEELEKEYFSRLEKNDLPPEKREELSYLRWVTLEEPDEVWRQQTASGDYRYTLISEFRPSNKPVWYICICLLLRGEPSFLYLAFPTWNAEMVASYRRGEKVQWIRPQQGKMAEENESQTDQGEQLVDGLADEWTEDETLRAEITQKRRDDDIPLREYELYQACLEETLQEPDEVWSLTWGSTQSRTMFHFIRHYPEEKPGVWFVIVARETEDAEQLEILDAFPTRDPELVQRYRRGELQIGRENTVATSRLVH